MEAGQILIKRHDLGKISKKKLVQLAVKHKTWVDLYYERGLHK